MLDALVVGAGPAGLAASHELGRRGIDHIVLERGDAAGHSWAQVYDSLRLHTGKHLSSLPGLRFPRSAPLFVPARQFLDYLQEYASKLEIPVHTRCAVERARRENGHWTVDSSSGAFRCRTLVIATGVMSNPWVPEIPGRAEFHGTVIHSREYRRPEPYRGRRVLVVGAGNSAGEIAPELAAAGAGVTVAIRSGANVVPLTLLGIPIQYVAWAVLKLPRAAQEVVVEIVRRGILQFRGPPPFPPAVGSPFSKVPMIGFELVNAIRDGEVKLRGGLERLTRLGARFVDGSERPFDDIILATGYRAALGPVEGLVRRDPRGFALRKDGVVSVDQPDLYFVGHSYDGTGGLFNIRRDAPAAGRHILRRLRG